MMADYRVIWEIDVVAIDPRDAAEKAMEYMPHDKYSLGATVFDVIGDDGEIIRVDIEGEDDDE